MRPDWDETWMNVAHVIAKRSHCVRAQAGAVITSHDQRIVATGYNGPPANWKYIAPGASLDPARIVTPTTSCDQWCDRGKSGPANPLTYDDCPSIHAELNAIAYADRRDMEGGAIYITTNPCLDCSKVIANSGIKHVIYCDIVKYRSKNAPLLLVNSGVSVRVI